MVVVTFQHLKSEQDNDTLSPVLSASQQRMRGKCHQARRERCVCVFNAWSQQTGSSVIPVCANKKGTSDQVHISGGLK